MREEKVEGREYLKLSWTNAEERGTKRRQERGKQGDGGEEEEKGKYPEIHQ